MDELIFHCKKILDTLDAQYFNEKNNMGIIKKIYKIVSEILKCAENNVIYDEDIDFSSLTRNFVDETTEYLSPILFELETVGKILNDLEF